jgi:hypothetical protein
MGIGADRKQWTAEDRRKIAGIVRRAMNMVKNP